MGNLATRLSALSPDKLALLRRRLQAAGGEAARTRIARQRRDGEAFPLSFAQERLWFLDQLQPGSTMYHIPEVYGFPGPLNVAALEQSLNEIVRRHETLRTRFAVRGGAPVQIVADYEPSPLARIDLRGIDQAQRYAEVQRLIAQAAATPFDLTRDRLFRTVLLELGDAEHVLLVTMHHIVSDGWSMDVFARELTQLYDAYSAGGASPLPELSIQYVDFAQWQRQALSGEALQRDLLYWKRQLEGAPAVLDLPTDRPRPAVQTFRGSAHYFAVSPSVETKLKTLAQSEGATLFILLLAAFKVLLYRWSGQPDQVVGTLIANRNRVEIEGLIGFFVNTLVLRTDLSGNPGFRELLRRVRETTLEGFAHQDLPFEKLVEELHPERRLSHHPLFQVLFALQNIPTNKPAGSLPEPDAPRTGSRNAKFDLALFMTEAGSGLIGAFEYNTDLFDQTTIAAMAVHLVGLLAGVAVDPDAPILDIALDDGAADRRVDDAWRQGRGFADKFEFEQAQ
jgi:hypothetical protein